VSTSGIVRTAGDGVELRVRLTPKSVEDRVDGIETRGDEPFLKVRVRAVPDGGKANTALERLIADWIGVARGRVSLISGHTARLKTVAVSGEPLELTPVIEDLIATLTDE
jgi:uncharacterized protein